jgi:hypothetical protein
MGTSPKLPRPLAVSTQRHYMLERPSSVNYSGHYFVLHYDIPVLDLFGPFAKLPVIRLTMLPRRLNISIGGTACQQRSYWLLYEYTSLGNGYVGYFCKFAAFACFHFRSFFHLFIFVTFSLSSLSLTFVTFSLLHNLRRRAGRALTRP